MNAIDLVVCLVVVLAVWNGWRQGFVVQLFSLAGLAAGIWLAARFGAQVGAWLRLDPDFAAAGGFVTVLVAAILLVALAGRLVRKLFRFAGFGFLDILLGIAVSVVKYALLLGVLFAAFDAMNRDFGIVSAQTLADSKTYRPVLRLSERIFPFVERVLDRVPEDLFRRDEPQTPQAAGPVESV